MTITEQPAWYPRSAHGSLQLQEPMARHTTWEVGGCADIYYEPADVEDLAVFLPAVPAALPITWIGRGSNLLVRDGGLSGVVVNPMPALNHLERLPDDRLRVDAGVVCPRLARFAVMAGLSGAEFMAGVPGCIGGALRMNAGAFGSEIWDVVDCVRTIDRAGRTQELHRSDFSGIGYRHVDMQPDMWFISATLTLTPDSVSACRRRLRDLMRHRRETQPVKERSCGSVFRNPPGDHAARLIDECGLRGMRIGGAMVSPQHANFIINTGAASAADIETLISDMRQAVRERFNVALQTEVCVIGSAAGRGMD